MSLAPDVVEALVGGRHRDPFAVLGPHAGRRGTVAIRTLQPDAAKVSVILGGEPVEEHPMQALHPAGLWETTVPGRSGLTYRLRITDHEGRTRDEDDPYRFPSTLSDYDLHLLGEGTHYRVYDKLGAHPARLEGVNGTIFAVWAPNARRVSVVGDWNVWDGRRHPMRLHPANGIWELFLPGVGPGAHYKYEILGPGGDLVALRPIPGLRLRARR
jgi:1,4-alpha-glucan branching enzyme